MPYIGKKPENIIATAIDSTTGTFSGDIDASTVNATGDTAAGDNAAIGFTSAEGLILTGQGSTSDITVKNDADATVFTVPTGTDDILFPDNAKAMFGAGSDLQIFHDGDNSFIKDSGTGRLSVLTSQLRLNNAADSEIMISATQDDAVELYHNGSKKIETTSGGVTVTGNIANTSGDMTIDVVGDLIIDVDGQEIFLKDDGTHFGGFKNVSSDFVIKSAVNDKDIIFQGTDNNSGIEAARFDMSNTGMFLLGKTASAADTKGIELHNGGSIVATVDGGTILYVNRESSAGNLAEFRKDNTAVGHISTDFDTIAITGAASTASHTSGLAFVSSSSAQRVVPCQQGTSIADDVMNLGGSGQRFDDIHASNGTIQTSDRNDKQDIEELTDAEKRVAVVAKGLMRKFRWKSAVIKKSDKARTHFGIIAQDLEDAFKAEGLDATKYAMFCSDTWWEKEITVDAVEAKDAVYEEVTNSDGTTKLVSPAVKAQDAYTRRDVKEEATEGYTEKTRLGVRYSELLAFIISAI